MKKQTIPPKPEKPSPNECCGSGCYPCVFDYFYSALEEWEEKYQTEEPECSNSDS